MEIGSQPRTNLELQFCYYCCSFFFPQQLDLFSSWQHWASDNTKSCIWSRPDQSGAQKSFISTCRWFAPCRNKQPARLNHKVRFVFGVSSTETSGVEPAERFWVGLCWQGSNISAQRKESWGAKSFTWSWPRMGSSSSGMGLSVPGMCSVLQAQTPAPAAGAV